MPPVVESPDLAVARVVQHPGDGAIAGITSRIDTTTQRRRMRN